MRLKTLLLVTAIGSMPAQLLAQDVLPATEIAASDEVKGKPNDPAVSPSGQVAPPGQTRLSEESTAEIIIVGTRIVGARVTEALPVVVLDEEKLDAIGAVSGDELIRAIPQMGDVTFNPGNNAQTSNAARGDVGSVDLRSLGVGNTLVLLNGRRIVTHPASQGLSDTGTVPVLSYNSNAIPTMGLQRLEILLDGAAALYGSDAVAGVVNTVIKDNYNGLRLDGQYGGAEGTHLREYQFGVLGGKNFSRGNASVAGYYLEALVVFGAVTGIDPTTLGPKERAADELGLGGAAAMALQKVASDELRNR